VQPASKYVPIIFPMMDIFKYEVHLDKSSNINSCPMFKEVDYLMYNTNYSFINITKKKTSTKSGS
jgi:hypothetical protein